MALQWADDFTQYKTGNNSRLRMLDGLPYSLIASLNGGIVTTDPDPNSSTGRAFQTPSGNFSISLPNVITTGTVGISAQIWFNSFTTAFSEFFNLQDGSTNTVVAARVQANGSVVVVGQVSNTVVTVADSVNPILSPSSYNVIEIAHNKGTGAGTLFINGVSRLTWTGVDTNRNIEIIGFNRAGNAPPVFLKNLIIWDSSGTSFNTPVGNAQVLRLKPNADVTLGSWVPSVGSTGFNLLAKDTPDDSTYLSANDTLPSAEMSFNFTNLPPDVTSVLGLVFVTRQRKTDGGDANIQSALSPDGTTWDNGDNRPITTAFQYEFDVSELSPVTTSPWTPLEVDSLVGRIDRTL